MRLLADLDQDIEKNGRAQIFGRVVALLSIRLGDKRYSKFTYATYQMIFKEVLIDRHKIHKI
jgi:hypothetical protein